MHHVRRIHIAILSLSMLVLLLPTVAFGVDGVVLIDQNRALAGNVTPGDAPGFPVTISQPGSYRLSSNLSVTANTDAIQITSSNVAIDLNGFSILGAGGISGFGIVTRDFTTARLGIVIQNGTIQGMGPQAIALSGDAHTVRNMNIITNGGGISISPVVATDDQRGSVVEHNVVRGNLGAYGITVSGGRVSYNTSDGNGYSGVSLGLGTALHNVSTRNGEYGLNLGASVSYVGNVMDGNVLGSVTGGVNHGQNLCNGVTCAGAVH